MTDWQPTASLAALKQRAGLYAMIRRFFSERAVMEVPPVLIRDDAIDIGLDNPRLIAQDAALHVAPPSTSPVAPANGSTVFRTSSICVSKIPDRINHPFGRTESTKLSAKGMMTSAVRLASVTLCLMWSMSTRPKVLRSSVT